MRLSVLLATCAVAFGLSGCATHQPLAPTKADQAAKEFRVKQDSAKIYIVRPGGFFGAMAGFDIKLDGQKLGGLPAGTYRMASVSPGKHRVTGVGLERNDEVEVELAKGKIGFVSVNESFGILVAQPSVAQVPAQKGISQVKEADLIAK